MRRYPIILLAVFCLVGQVAAQSNEAALWDAARNGDVKLVQRLIDEGVDVNAQTEYGATALSYAADRGYSEVVRLLLENGAQVNAMDSFYKVTPIVWAAYEGNLEVVRLMIEHGADLSSPKPLQWASFGGHTGVVELIAQNHVGEVCMATPAISDGMLFVRGQHHLFGIGGQLASRQ